MCVDVCVCRSGCECVSVCMRVFACVCVRVCVCVRGGSERVWSGAQGGECVFVILCGYAYDKVGGRVEVWGRRVDLGRGSMLKSDEVGVAWETVYGGSRGRGG